MRRDPKEVTPWRDKTLARRTEIAYEAAVLGKKANIFKARYLHGKYGRKCGGYKWEGRTSYPGRSVNLPCATGIVRRPVRPSIPAAIDAGAKRTWKKLAPVLERIGLLTEVDGPALMAICQAQSILESLYRELGGTTSELKNANGEDVLTLEDRRAALRAEIRRQQANFRLMASEFGLTPRGRVSLVVGSKDRDDNEDLLTKPAR